MAPFLHMRTTFFVVSMIGLILLVCMIYVGRARKTFPGFSYWTAASGCYFLGNILIGLRGVIPDFFSIVVANMIVVAAFLAIPYGLVLFGAERHPKWPYLAILLVVGAIAFYFTYILPSLSSRIVLISGVFAVLTAYALYIFKKSAPSGPSSG